MLNSFSNGQKYSTFQLVVTVKLGTLDRSEDKRHAGLMCSLFECDSVNDTLLKELSWFTVASHKS